VTLVARRVLRLIGPIGLCLAASAALADEWPALEAPPRAASEWVAQQMRVNGMPSRIMRFESELTVDEVLAHYQRRWSKAGTPAPQAVSLNEWRSVNVLQGPYQLSVQARKIDGGRTEGLLSAANLKDLKSDYVPKDWPRFNDTQVMQVTESQDGPRQSLLMSSMSRSSYGVNVQRWRQEWQRRGYALTRETELPASAGQRGWMAFFDNGEQTMDVTITELPGSGKVAILANRSAASGRGR